MTVIVNKLHLIRNSFSSYSSFKTYCQKVSTKFPRRIFSGIQPTGKVHLGNYLGAVKRWVELQDSEQMPIWSIVDMHSITVPHDPKILNHTILEVTATLLACGIDPKRSILFQQSSISLHAQLCWVLGCLTTMARLSHLPQYKEKSTSLKIIPLGLYIYPVLQAADILLYRATHVPVGEDQAQHIQLAQDLAESFNGKFGLTFPVPRTLISDDPSQKIKSLRHPAKKMSKSDVDYKGCLNITADPEELFLRIKRAVTDCISEVAYNPSERPGIANLINIHSVLTEKSPDQICQESSDLDTGKYKLLVAEVVIEKLRPIREEYQRLIDDPGFINNILENGNAKAREIAVDCWQEVSKKVGFTRKNLYVKPMQVYNE